MPLARSLPVLPSLRLVGTTRVSEIAPPPSGEGTPSVSPPAASDSADFCVFSTDSARLISAVSA